MKTRTSLGLGRAAGGLAEFLEELGTLTATQRSALAMFVFEHSPSSTFAR